MCGCINSNGYLAAYILKESWTLHRMIWLYVHGYLPKQLDHIDGDRTNNRLVNLREATPRLNSQNKHAARADSKTGYIGVSKRPNYPRWRARIVIGEKRVALGDFDSPQEARDAYLAAKRRHHEGCTI